MNRGRDYYSLLHEKEQLLARLNELEQRIKLKTSNFLEESKNQDRIETDFSLETTDNTINDELGVLITDNDLDNKKSKLKKKQGNFDFEEQENNPASKSRTLEAGKPSKSRGELQYNNKTYFLEFIKIPLLIDGNIDKLLTLIKDVPAKHTTDQTPKLLGSVFETMDDFVVVKNLDQKIIMANNAFLKAIGKNNVDELPGFSEYDFIGDETENQKSLKEDQIAQKLKKGESIESESTFILKDGSAIDTLVKRFPIYKGDELIATASIFQNITSLKNEYRKLKRSEEKYRMIIENQGEGVCIVDSSDKFIYANSAAEKLFDSRKHGLIDRSLEEFITETDFNQIKTELKQVDPENTKTYEIGIKSLNNTKKYVLLTASPFYNNNGYLVGSFILFRDITERRKIEENLLKSELSLKETIATKDKFFSIIAHDLKNPFGSIMGFSELILRKLETNNIEKIEHYAKIIRSASKHGFELLENLLAWSRSQNGTLRYSPTKVSLQEIINHNIDVLRESAENKKITVIYDDSENIPVFIDEDMINTVLRNLLSNAIKYSNPNSKIIISVSKTNNNYARVAVADEGVGMIKSNLNQLFRIDSNKSTPGTGGEEGTGLGLILCKEFIMKNKGEIWADSIPNKGSTFYITLPMA